jgi:voltage-gated potassium channel
MLSLLYYNISGVIVLIFRNIMQKSNYYTVDEFGVKNYKYLPIGISSIIIYVLLNVTFGIIAFFAESTDPNSPVKTIFDSIWLMVMSSTTIGFGNVYPITLIGRICVFMMFILGVGILGGVGAIFANKIFGFADTNIKNRELRKQNTEIYQKITELEKKIDNLVEKINNKKLPFK